MAIIAATGAALAGRLGWPLELFTHFRPHLIVLATAATLVLAFYDPRLAGACLLAALVNAATLPLPHRPPTPAPGGATILWANVWHNERALARTIVYARDQRADIILLGEFPAVDAAWLAAHAPDYRTIVDPGPQRGANSTRVVAISRLAFDRVVIQTAPQGDRRPMLWLTLHVKGKALLIGALHPSAPGSPAMLRDRDAMIARTFAKATTPAILVGDFNATPWSPILQRTGWRRAGAPFATATWPSQPFPVIPIDHVYSTDGVLIDAYRVAPFLGSDHRALLFRCVVVVSAAPVKELNGQIDPNNGPSRFAAAKRTLEVSYQRNAPPTHDSVRSNRSHWRTTERG